MKMEHACGRIDLRQPKSDDACAYRAAMLLLDLPGAWSVTVDPHGAVTLERPRHVNPDDLVGTYTAEPGLFGLWRQITGDLRAHVRERPLAPYVRRVTYKNRRPRAA